MNPKQRMQVIAEAIIIAVIFLLIVLSLTKVAMFAVVEGKSMEPILQTGDLVFIVKVPPNSLNVGDVIVYKRPTGEFVIHRIIKILRIGKVIAVVPKGDNNMLPDGEIPITWIVGKVIELDGAVIKIPGLGYLTLCLRTLESSLIR